MTEDNEQSQRYAAIVREGYQDRYLALIIDSDQRDEARERYGDYGDVTFIPLNGDMEERARVVTNLNKHERGKVKEPKFETPSEIEKFIRGKENDS